MNTGGIVRPLTTLLHELVNGVERSAAAYVLNPGDVGLLRSLDRIPAPKASTLTATGSSIASHCDHLRYGLSLMNRWAGGDNPWDTADWTASWRKTRVTDDEWDQLRRQLRDETHRWLEVMQAPRDLDEADVNGMIGSVVHLAYHLGAIRQIDQAVRGPTATE